MSKAISSSCRALAAKPKIPFSNWRDGRRQRLEGSLEVPPEAGIYTVWRGEEFLYVGVAGTGKKHGGLRQRLKQHHDGKRGMDKFSIYGFDRFVLPALSMQKIGLVAKGKLSLDEVPASLIQKQLAFAFLVCDVNLALLMEKKIQQGGWEYLSPLFNAI